MLLPLTLLSFLLTSIAVAQNDADVLILGAGMAGQTAAEYFMMKNVSFLMIEGAAETGGRIKSAMFGDRMVELGPDGIYATNATKQAMVDMYNITGMYADFENVSVRLPDETEPETEANASWDMLLDAQKKVKELYDKIKSGVIQDMSVRVALEYGKWIPKTPIDDVIEIYDYDFETSKIPEESSTYEVMSSKPYEEKPYLSNDQRGLQKIFEKIAHNDSRLKLNEVVTKISHNGSAVTVMTKSGKTFTGKYAIVTFSMGVLKSGSVTFEPALPEWKWDTIYKTSMDPYTNIYVTFPTGTDSYWGSDEYVLYASPRRGYYPILWNLEAGNFSSTGKPMIAFHVMGEEARRVEKASNETVKVEITDVLKKMFGENVTEPDDIYVTRWNEDPLVMGSFSSGQVGYNKPMFMDALKSRFGRVHFAGEAYNNETGGYLVGAIASGNKTAMVVHNCMMGRECPSYNPDAYKPQPPEQPTCGAEIRVASVLLLSCAILYLL